MNYCALSNVLKLRKHSADSNRGTKTYFDRYNTLKKSLSQVGKRHPFECRLLVMVLSDHYNLTGLLFLLYNASILTFFKYSMFVAIKKYTESGIGEGYVESNRQNGEKERSVTENILARNQWCVKAYSTIRAVLCDSKSAEGSGGKKKRIVCEWFSHSKKSIWKFLQGHVCSPWDSVEVTTWCFMGLFVLPLAFWRAWACFRWQHVHMWGGPWGQETERTKLKVHRNAAPWYLEHRQCESALIYIK